MRHLPKTMVTTPSNYYRASRYQNFCALQEGAAGRMAVKLKRPPSVGITSMLWGLQSTLRTTSTVDDRNPA